MRLAIVFFVLTLFTRTSYATDSGFIQEPVGQATGQTCQSYSLAIALAFKRDSAFPLQTPAEIRKAEITIRAKIVASANGHPPNKSVNHDDIRRGLEAYTNNKYTLISRDVDLPQLLDSVSARTGISSATGLPISFPFGVPIKDVAFSSATRISSDPYKDGHIFTLLGTDGPPNSNQRVLILNSAIKIRDISRNACEPGIPDEPGNYTASVSWKRLQDIQFKSFGNKLKLWYVEAK
jgi:hypothetical protein